MAAGPVIVGTQVCDSAIHVEEFWLRVPRPSTVMCGPGPAAVDQDSRGARGRRGTTPMWNPSAEVPLATTRPAA